MRKPCIQDLRLEKCCVEALHDIDERLKLARIFKVGLVGSVFATMLSPNRNGFHNCID
jgi:hypothetical protein